MKKLVLLLLICASTQLQGMDFVENGVKQLKKKMYQLRSTKGFWTKTLQAAKELDSRRQQQYSLIYDGAAPEREQNILNNRLKILQHAYNFRVSKSCHYSGEGSCYEDLLKFREEIDTN